ncbi:MAG: PorP/SprF family type IX secretion system membrane protein [Bacteroidota bacterium]|jgi:type IX secretion system PorP/SprF family membrane protein
MKSKEIKIFILLFLTSLSSFSQQMPNYAQFTLNKLSINPAYGGSHIGMEIWAGKRNQWIGFENAPVQTFMSCTYSWRRNFNYKAVHSVGGYVEEDRIGLFTFKSAHAYYSYHLKISKAFKMGFGLFVGAKNVAANSILYNLNDPAFNIPVNPNFYLGPDFVPGWRLYSRNMFVDVAVRNIYVNKLKQASKQFGTPSKLVIQPTLLFGYRFHSATNEFVFVPTVKLQGAYNQPPLADINFITYYRKKVGLGITYRVHNTAAVMLQVRVKHNITLGFAYEYAINNLRDYFPHTTEAIFGFSPMMGTDAELPSSYRVDMCPEFDY